MSVRATGQPVRVSAGVTTKMGPMLGVAAHDSVPRGAGSTETKRLLGEGYRCTILTKDLFSVGRNCHAT